MVNLKSMIGLGMMLMALSVSLSVAAKLTPFDLQSKKINPKKITEQSIVGEYVDWDSELEEYSIVKKTDAFSRKAVAVYNAQGILLSMSTYFSNVELETRTWNPKKRQWTQGYKLSDDCQIGIEELANITRQQLGFDIKRANDISKVNLQYDNQITHRYYYEISRLANSEKSLYDGYVITADTGEVVYQATLEGQPYPSLAPHGPPYMSHTFSGPPRFFLYYQMSEGYHFSLDDLFKMDEDIEEVDSADGNH